MKPKIQRQNPFNSKDNNANQNQMGQVSKHRIEKNRIDSFTQKITSIKLATSTYQTWISLQLHKIQQCHKPQKPKTNRKKDRGKEMVPQRRECCRKPEWQGKKKREEQGCSSELIWSWVCLATVKKSNERNERPWKKHNNLWVFFFTFIFQNQNQPLSSLSDVKKWGSCGQWFKDLRVWAKIWVHTSPSTHIHLLF